MSKSLTWKTITVKLGDLIEYDKNPVQISERDAKELSVSLKKYNNVIPYVAAAPPNGKASIPLLDGHQRKLVSMQINKVSANTMVEVRVPSRKLTEKEKQELIIRLRKNTGEFDYDKLANFFDVPDLLDWGFTEKELLGAGFEFGDETKDAEPQIDRAAELLKKWKVKKGDLWQIGDHRLICGDCTDAAVVARVMDGEKAGACVTDSPYGINREGIENDDPEGLQELFDGCLAVMPIENGVIINFQSPRLFPVWLDAIRAGGHKFERALWMHKINDVTNAWRQWMMNGEIIIISSVGKAKWGKPSPPSQDCYTVTHDIEAKISHTSVKPLPVFQNVIEHTTGDVYEPFNGSGTTLVACQNLNRRGRAIEISPAYCSVTLQRMRDAFPDIEIKRIKS